MAMVNVHEDADLSQTVSSIHNALCFKQEVEICYVYGLEPAYNAFEVHAYYIKLEPHNYNYNYNHACIITQCHNIDL